MIQIKDLHYSYGSKPVFSGLSLELHPGHIYGLLGKNGTGKSTLLRTIGGLLFPRQGSIQVLGYNPGKRQPDFLRQVFMVPEEFYFPNISIKAFVAGNAPFYPNYSQEQFDRYLQEFSIPLDQLLQEMSYGQKKKLLISFALACNTPVLLMDEPTNGLDIMSKSQFRKVMAGAVADNKCILISTHQVKDLENLIDRITIIDEGNILFDQTVDRICNRLNFKISFDSDEIRTAIYQETSLKGNAIITSNNEEEDSRIDLEMLYKAIVTNKEAVHAAFK
ncbi:ABC transporter ATP-binding protein [Flavihumibacter fluvii]|uniref:ABC transporter ATP-binding protein n=1 Tax=Flavihumibacter fluvii TaxID=2838157 RepID=UPI001BDF28DC|nr:ABC transporter ATP-binding protein [Flavihumibacter fluvii]ULQ52829.1 ABC transporter ATP-binding protein [Flavihumibacter fluvii]